MPVTQGRRDPHLLALLSSADEHFLDCLCDRNLIEYLQTEQTLLVGWK